MIIGILNNSNTLAYEMLKKAIKSHDFKDIRFIDSTREFKLLMDLVDGEVPEQGIIIVNFDQPYDINISALIDIDMINNFSGTLQELKGKIIQEFLYTSRIFPNINTKEIFQEFVMTYRSYHNVNHIRNVLMDYLLALAYIGANKYNEVLFYAIMYHDFVYDPKARDNEQQSAYAFRKLAIEEGKLDLKLIEEVQRLIIDTADFEKHPFLEHDVSVYKGIHEEIIEAAKAITNEYSYLNFDKFRKGNANILNRLKLLVDYDINEGIDIQINFLKRWRPRVGVFCGSFSPFHNGHRDVLNRSTKIFDKVIIVQAINPNKSNNNQYSIFNVSFLDDTERYYVTNIPDLIFELDAIYNVTLIRGIRNGMDAEDSINWEYYLNKLNCCTPVVNISSNPEHRSLSSSGIREVERLYADEKPFLRPL